jgi:hypothetical protein
MYSSLLLLLISATKGDDNSMTTPSCKTAKGWVTCGIEISFGTSDQGVPLTRSGAQVDFTDTNEML